jgi:hypothetical protein
MAPAPSDIPITVSGVPQELTITTNGKLSHKETIVLPDTDLPVTLTGVNGAQNCGPLVLPAGGTWTLTIG